MSESFEFKVYIAGDTHTIKAASYSEFPRDEEGTCALCHGDPCAENGDTDTLIYRHMFNGGSTCPVCEGRPT